MADKVYIMGVEIGGKNREDAIKALGGVALDENETVEIIADGRKITFTAGEVGARYNPEKTVDDAIRGSKGVFSGWFKKEYDMAVVLDNALLDKKLGDVETKVKETAGVIVDEGIQVTNGVKGVELDREKLMEVIIDSFAHKNDKAVEIPFVITQPQKVDYTAFLTGFEAGFSEPVYIRDDDGEIKVTKESVGVIMDKADAEGVMKKHTKEGEVYIIPCQVKYPDHTKEEFEEALFRDMLSTYTTSYSTSSANRCSNVELATKSIDGIILLPGEEFSFNDALGERTKERGYKPAGAYVSGKTVQEVGGGICQVSSTLYNTVLLSNLEIASRRSHQLTVAYVPLGRDATVNWGTTDFKFRNNTIYPVKLSGHCENKKVTIDMMGTMVEPDMTVKIETSTVSVLEPEEEIVEDPEMYEGETKTEKGSRGYVVDAVRVVYSKDGEVSREKLTRSRYNPVKTVVTVGTKVRETEEVATEEIPVTGTITEEIPTEEIPTEAVTEEVSETGL